MAASSENCRRAFADVVTIDAWHAAFDAEHVHVDLHADVVFGTARVGGEADSPVRFRLSVRRAEVVVVIPESEPVSVDLQSVARETLDRQGRLTETLEQNTHAGTKGKFAMEISPSALGVSASAEGNVQGSTTTNKKVEISSRIQFMTVVSSKTNEGHYRWLVIPSTSTALEGRPWDAVEQPRLKLIDQRKNRTKGLPPTVRVEVRCRREDLVIDDLQVKDERIWDTAKRGFGFKNKVAAAVSYIRDRLAEEGLEVNNIEDIFGIVTLGSVMAEAI